MFKNQHNTTLYVKIVSLGHRLVHHYEPINLTIKPLKSKNFSGFFMFKQFFFPWFVPDKNFSRKWRQ